MKAVNVAWRKFARTKDPSELHALGLDAAAITRLSETIATAYSWEKQPYPRWRISNLGAVIRDTQKKLERSERRDTQADTSGENTETGVRWEDSPQDNRVRLFFPGKPAVEIRTALKRHGFRWAPSSGCWQAYRNWRAMEHAKTYLKGASDNGQTLPATD
jgi:hypothetical protein